MLGLFKEILLEDNVLPRSTNVAKKIVCPLELEVQKIHACVNDCILYRGEYEIIVHVPHASMHDTSAGEQRTSTNWMIRSR